MAKPLLALWLVSAAPAMALCGDGVLDWNEECDDGNLAAGDGCSVSCHFESLCLVTNDGGFPATSSVVHVARDGSLTNLGATTLPGNNDHNGHLMAARCGRRVYMSLRDAGNSAIAGFDVAFDGTVTPVPTAMGLFLLEGLVCNGSQGLLFGLQDFGLSGAQVLAFSIAADGTLTPADTLNLPSPFIIDIYADFHPLNEELYVATHYDVPLGAGPETITISRVGYDAAGNLSLLQAVSAAFQFATRRVRDIGWTPDGQYLALPGYFDGASECFAHYDSPGTTIPPLEELNTSCSSPLPGDPRGFAVAANGTFYYQSAGASLHAASFSGATIVDHGSITPVHVSNQLLLGYNDSLLVSLGPGAGEVATYEISSGGSTLALDDTAALDTGVSPDSGALVSCPDLDPGPVVETVVIHPSDLQGWSPAVFGEGSYEFTAGPGATPSGGGSLRLAGGPSAQDDVAQVVTSRHQETRLADLTALLFNLYVAAHPSDANYTGTFTIAIDHDDIGSDLDELVFFEAVYNGYNQEIAAWQTWDVRNAEALWSYAQGGPPPSGTTFSIDELLITHPDATIVSVGYAAGGGPATTENFEGYLDGVLLSANGITTIHDFEPEPLFADGFESGDTRSWSTSVP